MAGCRTDVGWTCDQLSTNEPYRRRRTDTPAAPPVSPPRPPDVLRGRRVAPRSTSRRRRRVAGGGPQAARRRARRVAYAGGSAVDAAAGCRVSHPGWIMAGLARTGAVDARRPGHPHGRRSLKESLPHLSPFDSAVDVVRRRDGSGSGSPPLIEVGGGLGATCRLRRRPPPTRMVRGGVVRRRARRAD